MGKPRRRVRLEPEKRWTERRIASLLAHALLRGRSVLVVPNTHWTGAECDLLVIEPGLRIIDVEIKISRADLKADAKKDKWWKTRPWSRRHPASEREPRQWPDKVWKHYYVMPEEIWDDALLATLPEASGIVLLTANSQGYSLRRQAKPSRDAKPISPADAVDLARLASLRLWSALANVSKE